MKAKKRENTFVSALMFTLCMIATTFISACSSDDEDKVETLTMTVSAEMGTDYDTFDTKGEQPFYCLVVTDNKTSEWYKVGLTAIDGFEYEEGYEYLLKVRRTRLANPPQDASIYTYSLITILSKTKRLYD